MPTMTIPQIRERLIQLSVEHDLPELVLLAEETRRRPPVKVKAPATSRPLTHGVVIGIRAYASQHPTASHQQLAEIFHVNNGRVSEALRGKREDG
jgi:hypothetical protein